MNNFPRNCYGFKGIRVISQIREVLVDGITLNEQIPAQLLCSIKDSSDFSSS